MQTLDYIAISLFTAGILCAGLLFARSGRTMKNFFSAGGAVPWGMAGLSLFMGFFSAGTFVVWGSIAYSSGWVAVTIQWTMCAAGLIVGLLIAPRWRRTGALTAAEYIAARLGLGVQKTYTLLFLAVSLFTTGSFLYPVGKILEVSTSLPLEACILLIGGISILYVTVGGLRAVVVTDVLQFVILFAAVAIVVPLAFDEVGGVAGFQDKVPDTFFDLTNEEYSWDFMIAFGIYNTIFLGGNWAYVQRYTTVRDPRSARKAGCLFGALYTLSPVLWMLPPMIYYAVDPTLSGLNDEGAYLLMCREALPAGLLGLMLGGMIFATASSLNATLNISAAVFTNDIFKRLRPRSGERTLVRTARASTIAFGVLAVAVALLIPRMGGVVNVVISVGALTGVPLYLPVVWSLFSRRQTGRTVLGVTGLSLAVNLFFKFGAPPLFGFSLTRAEEMILGVGFPFAALALCELRAIGRGSVSQRYLEYRAARRDAPCADATQRAESQRENAYSLRVAGAGILLAGAAIVALGAAASSGQGVVCGTGAALAAAGAVIYYRNKPKQNRL
ncbi:sodium:solute symporter family protein [Alistipes sp.]|uniref:sodium:solute symporter family protein n=1 Tax=Alistipes sp. TaxID=1872444 RepID=UPI003AF0BD74